MAAKTPVQRLAKYKAEEEMPVDAGAGQKQKASQREEEAEEPRAKQHRRGAAAASSAAAAKDSEQEQPAAKSSGKKSTKKGNNKVAPPDEEEVSFSEAMKAMSKLSLNTAQQVRQLTAAAFTTFLVPTSLAFIKAAEDEGKAYAKAAKGKGGANLGPPHIHIVAGVLDVLADDKTFSEAQPEPHRVLLAIQDQMKTNLNDCPFTYFRIKPTYKKPEHEQQQYKITWAVDPLATCCSDVPPQSIQKAMISCLSVVCPDAQLKRGPPPKGEVERAVERLLKKL
jgi:hypothetical protein